MNKDGLITVSELKKALAGLPEDYTVHLVISEPADNELGETKTRGFLNDVDDDGHSVLLYADRS